MIQSAVLLLILNNNDILFIKRNRNLKFHSGEISFPGGKFDESTDKSFVETAQRETFEEIGLTKDNYSILYELKPEKTVSTNFIVHTFIAKVISDNLNFKINKKEVEEIITIPINHFFNPKYKVKVPLKLEGKTYLNTFYYFRNYMIWGATSRILDNFLKYYLTNNDKHK